MQTSTVKLRQIGLKKKDIRALLRCYRKWRCNRSWTVHPTAEWRIKGSSTRMVFIIPAAPISMLITSIDFKCPGACRQLAGVYGLRNLTSTTTDSVVFHPETVETRPEIEFQGMKNYCWNSKQFKIGMAWHFPEMEISLGFKPKHIWKPSWDRDMTSRDGRSNPRKLRVPTILNKTSVNTVLAKFIMSVLQLSARF